jgi:hypothetical protein
MEKFRAEITAIGENVWSTNAMVFNTYEEAKEWLIGLSRRWFGCDMGRVVTDDIPKNQAVNLEEDELIFNFRK